MMKRPRTQQLWQAACCLLCVLILLGDDFGGGEFVGGWLTGPLASMSEIAWTLFALALFLTFKYRRLAAEVALTGCALYVPLFLYLTAPGLFRWVFGGPFTNPLQASLVWGTWQSERMLALAATTYVCVRGLSPASDGSAIPP